jgi:hypothetical protein
LKIKNHVEIQYFINRLFLSSAGTTCVKAWPVILSSGCSAGLDSWTEVNPHPDMSRDAKPFIFELNNMLSELKLANMKPLSLKLSVLNKIDLFLLPLILLASFLAHLDKVRIRRS